MVGSGVARGGSLFFRYLLGRVAGCPMKPVFRKKKKMKHAEPEVKDDRVTRSARLKDARKSRSAKRLVRKTGAAKQEEEDHRQPRSEEGTAGASSRVLSPYNALVISRIRNWPHDHKLADPESLDKLLRDVHWLAQDALDLYNEETKQDDPIRVDRVSAVDGPFPMKMPRLPDPHGCYYMTIHTLSEPKQFVAQLHWLYTSGSFVGHVMRCVPFPDGVHEIKSLPFTSGIPWITKCTLCVLKLADRQRRPNSSSRSNAVVDAHEDYDPDVFYRQVTPITLEPLHTLEPEPKVPLKLLFDHYFYGREGSESRIKKYWDGKPNPQFIRSMLPWAYEALHLYNATKKEEDHVQLDHILSGPKFPEGWFNPSGEFDNLKLQALPKTGGGEPMLFLAQIHRLHPTENNIGHVIDCYPYPSEAPDVPGSCSLCLRNGWETY